MAYRRTVKSFGRNAIGSCSWYTTLCSILECMAFDAKLFQGNSFNEHSMLAAAANTSTQSEHSLTTHRQRLSSARLFDIEWVVGINHDSIYFVYTQEWNMVKRRRLKIDKIDNFDEIATHTSKSTKIQIRQMNRWHFPKMKMKIIINTVSRFFSAAVKC